MSGVQGDDAQVQRHEVVMRIMAINSDQLCCESERNGLEIELLRAKEEAAGHQTSADMLRKITDLESRAAQLDQKKEKNREELQRLDETLAQIDRRST